MRLVESILRKIIAEESAKLLAPRKRSLASYIFEEVQWSSKYTDFVSALASNADDPKVKAFISAGQLDKNPDDDKFSFVEKAILVTDLRPTQNEIDVDKSLAYPMKKPSDFVKYVNGDGQTFAPGGPIITYDGKYVIDGHHRWSQVYSCNSSAMIQAVDIQLPGLNPLDVLKAVQAAIAISAGNVPMQSVKGSNLLNLDKAGLRAWMKEKVNPGFYEAVMTDTAAVDKMKSMTKTSEQTAMGLTKTESMVFEYIWLNVQEMQAQSQPVPGAPKRDFMPQTDNIDWMTPLAKGDVDIAEPHADSAKLSVAAESRTRHDSLVMERWQKMAGLIKG